MFLSGWRASCTIHLQVELRGEGDTRILGAAFKQNTELCLGAGPILHSRCSAWGFQFPHLFPKTCLAVGDLHIFRVLSLYQTEYLQIFFSLSVDFFTFAFSFYYCFQIICRCVFACLAWGLRGTGYSGAGILGYCKPPDARNRTRVGWKTTSALNHWATTSALSFHFLDIVCDWGVIFKNPLPNCTWFWALRE